MLFSAAVPGQSGTGHLNERWPSYWQALFARNGYLRIDPVRRHIWQDERVELWYQQNIFLFASQDAINGSASLASEYRKAQANSIELVYEPILSRYTSFSRLLAQLPRAAWEGVRHRICS